MDFTHFPTWESHQLPLWNTCSLNFSFSRVAFTWNIKCLTWVLHVIQYTSHVIVISFKCYSHENIPNIHGEFMLIIHGHKCFTHFTHLIFFSNGNFIWAKDFSHVILPLGKLINQLNSVCLLSINL